MVIVRSEQIMAYRPTICFCELFFFFQHNHPQFFIYGLWLISCSNSRVQDCDRWYGPQNLKYVHFSLGEVRHPLVIRMRIK